MQWFSKKKKQWVIGSAKHSLLISHYRLFLSGDDVTEEVLTDDGRDATLGLVAPTAHESSVRDWKAPDGYNFHPDFQSFNSGRHHFHPETLIAGHPFYNKRPYRGRHIRGCPNAPAHRLFYPSYPPTRYRPLQSLDWFNQRLPPSYQYYYVMSNPPRNHVKIHPEQQPLAYCWSNVPSMVYYPPAANMDSESTTCPQTPYIYPGFAFHPLGHNNPYSRFGPPLYSSAPPVISQSDTDTSLPPQEYQPAHHVQVQNPKKKKRKRKRKRKSLLVAAIGSLNNDKQAANGGDADYEDDEEDDGSGSCTTLSGSLTDSLTLSSNINTNISEVMTSLQHGFEGQQNGVEDGSSQKTETLQEVILSESDQASVRCKNIKHSSKSNEEISEKNVIVQEEDISKSLLDDIPCLINSQTSDLRTRRDCLVDNLDLSNDNSNTLLDMLAKEIVSEAVTSATVIVSSSPKIDYDLHLDELSNNSDSVSNKINTSTQSSRDFPVKDQFICANNVFLTPYLDVLLPSEQPNASSNKENLNNCDLLLQDTSNIFSFNDIIPLETEIHSLPTNEPASRDFPHLPLVDNLFTINIIDSIINDALNEIKQNQFTEQVELQEEENLDLLLSDVASSPIDVPSKITDVPNSPIDIDDIDFEELPSSAEIVTDIVNHSALVTVNQESHEDSGNFPLEISHAPLVVNTISAPSEQIEYSDVPTDENDWSKCNGFLGDEDDESNPNPSDIVERELVTEIVFISETSFMDEAAMAEAELEDPDSPSLALNPEAPIFVPMTFNDRNPSAVGNYVQDQQISTEGKRFDECTSRFSDFDDRVDISDYEDDGPKSTPSSFSQTFIPTDDEFSSSFQHQDNETDKKDKLVENSYSATEDKPVETDAELDKQQIEEIHEEIREIKSIAGTLFEKLQLDKEGDFYHQNTPIQNSTTDAHFSMKNNEETHSANILTAQDKTDAMRTNREANSTKENTENSDLMDVNLDDELESTNIDNENAQMVDLEIDEYIAEKYMAHQQIYDPLKYKDYYQICSSVDVPDSPLDMNQDKSSKNLTLSRSQSDASSTPPFDRFRKLSNPASSSPSNAPPKTKPEAEDIPEALKSRISEIVLHEADDVSECGSEDVETIGHRYESSEGQKHIYVNQLSLAAELLRTKQNLPYDNEFKPIVPGTDATEASSTVATLQGTSLAGPRSNRSVYENYYGNPCFEMENMQVPTRKEVSDSGVQSEESADEADDSIRKGGDTSPDKASFAYKNFGAKRPKPMSAMLKGKSDPLCLCCQIM